MAVEGDVRVHGEVSEVSKGEIEEKCELDMSSYQDLPKGGDGECNEDLHGGHENDGVVGNGKDDTDGSYVFVSGSDVVADNPVKGVVNADDDPVDGVFNAVDGVFNAEEGIVVYPSNNDITLDGSPSISNGDKEGRSDVGEGENGTVVVESKLQQLDSELKVEESHESRLRSSKSSSNQEPDLYQNMVIAELASEIPAEGPPGGYAMLTKPDFEMAACLVAHKQLKTEVRSCHGLDKNGKILPSSHVIDKDIVELAGEIRAEGPPGGYAMLVKPEFEMAIYPVTDKLIKTAVSKDSVLDENRNSIPTFHVKDNDIVEVASEIPVEGPPGGYAMSVKSDFEVATPPVTDELLNTVVPKGSLSGKGGNSLPACHVKDMNVAEFFHGNPKEGPPGGYAMLVRSDFETAACPVTEKQVKTEVANGPSTLANDNSLPACHVEVGVPETEVINDTDCSQNTPELDGASDNAVDRAISEIETTHVSFKSGESLPNGPDLDSAIEPDVGTAVSSHSENGPIDGCMSNSSPTDMHSVPEISFRSGNCVEKISKRSCEDGDIESIVSNGVVDIASSQPIPANVLDIESHLKESVEPNCIVADLKSESEVENAVKSRDIQSFDVDESKFEVLNDSVVENNSLISVPEKDGGRSATGDGDNKQICQESEVPNCIVADLKSESEVENAVNSKDIQSCDVDESEFEVLNDSVVESTSLNFVPEKDGGGSATGDGDTSQICQENEVPNCIVADLKSESEVENAVKSRDIQSFDVDESKFEVLNDSVVESTSVNSVPEKDGDRSATGDGDNNQICQENEVIEEVDDNETATSAEGFGADAVDGQNVGTEAVRRPFYFLIRIPRYDDENLREQIRQAQLLVDEKTRIRDAIRVEIQTNRAIGKKFSDDFDAAILEERTARELLKKKRQEIDPVQSAINRVKSVMSIDEIDGKIRHMEHMIEHETLPLKEEKQLIREVKQLKQQREQISLTMGRQDEVQQAFDQKDKLEELFKSLKKEVDLLRDDVLKAEGVTQAAKKKYSDAYDKLDKLQAKFRAADVIRQDAYKNLQNLRKQLYDKNKYFRMYKEDEKVATDYAFSGDRESLQRLCVNQVEAIMDLWNKNDDFRKEYTRCNVRSTVRRLRTLDGRQLSHGEEPPVLPTFINPRVDRSVYSRPTANSVSLVPSIEEEKQVVPVETEKVEKVVEQKNQTGGKSKKPAKPKSAPLGAATVSGRDEEDKDKEEEEFKMKTKEEEELARKAEELRKQEEALKLKEQRRLEEKAKALEALERKKRAAEKAQARIELRAQKEAEQKEKERERRAKKKERKKAAANASSSGSNEKDSSPSLGEETRETETSIKDTEMREEKPQPSKGMTKRAVNTKQKKAASIPPPLRNRGKRRMQPWMWVLLAVFLVLIFFLVGSGGGFDLGMGRFGF